MLVITPHTEAWKQGYFDCFHFHGYNPQYSPNNHVERAEYLAGWNECVENWPGAGRSPRTVED